MEADREMEREVVPEEEAQAIPSPDEAVGEDIYAGEEEPGAEEEIPV